MHDTSSFPALLPSRPTAGRWSLTTIALASFLALGFFVSVALPYLLLDPAVLARYEPRRAWLRLKAERALRTDDAIAARTPDGD
jgi:hypothetical protein